MTLSRRELKRVNSPQKSPRLLNTSLRKKVLLKKLSSDVQFGASSKANLKVVVRVRPYNSREIENNAKQVVQVVDDHMLVFDPKDNTEDFFYRGRRQEGRDLNKKQNREQKFVFEKVFNEDATNQEVFEATTHDIVDTVLQGFNCSVFAYGATGAGKTYTMLGKPEVPGITFLTVMELFQRIDELKEEKTCEVGVSYLEVYNETVRDLLNPGKPLNVLETGKKVEVKGLSLHKPKSAEELMDMLASGNRSRSQHPTDINAESSRSHAVFQVFVKIQEKVGSMKTNIGISKLSMIDLAGSERGCATGFKGARFREGASINRSLLALGNCINALADGKKHINYRDSKLTRLLKDSLGGNCRSVMIAAITTAGTSYEDTFNTLRYANRAKTIKTTLKKNIMNVDQHVSQYVKIVENLQEEIRCLQAKIHELERQPIRINYDDTGNIDISNMQTRQPSEREIELQSMMSDLDKKLKTEVKELLRLEAQEKELHLKVHLCELYRERASILAFASMRLDKSVSKCDRMLHSTESRLNNTKMLKQAAEKRVSEARAKLQEVVDELCNLDDKDQFTGSNTVVECNSLKGSLRDYEQLLGYYQGLVKTCFIEQAASEKVIHLLLNACKRFYLYIQSKNIPNNENDEMFQNIIKCLDSYKVGFDSKEEITEDVGSNIGKLTNFSIDHKLFMSPIVAQTSQPKCVRSILRDSVSTQNSDEFVSPVSSSSTFSSATMDSMKKLLDESPIKTTVNTTISPQIEQKLSTEEDNKDTALPEEKLKDNSDISNDLQIDSISPISNVTLKNSSSYFSEKVPCSKAQCEELMRIVLNSHSYGSDKDSKSEVKEPKNEEEQKVREMPQNLKKSYSSPNLNETFDSASSVAQQDLYSIKEMSPVQTVSSNKPCLNSTIVVSSGAPAQDLNSTYVQETLPESVASSQPAMPEKQTIGYIKQMPSRSRQPISLEALESLDIEKPEKENTQRLMDTLNSTFNVGDQISPVLQACDTNKKNDFAVPLPKVPPKSILKKTLTSQKSMVLKTGTGRTPCKRSASTSSLHSAHKKHVFSKDKLLGFGSSVKRTTSFLGNQDMRVNANKENLSTTRKLKSFKGSTMLSQYSERDSSK